MEIRNPEKYRAALYIRLSREDEREGPSESVANQQSMLERFAGEQGLTNWKTYMDDGWSGTNFDRPAFCRMIEDIEAGLVNMVITKDLSRLGRDYILTGHYMERYFPEKGVRYLSLLDGIDTGVESTANDITPFRAIMNDMYAKDISKKIKSVKRDKQRKGQFIGGKPVYGYRMHPTEKNKIVIDEEAAVTVRRIFAMALEGESCRQIAAALNREGVPTPAEYAGLPVGRTASYKGLWSSERISEMLRNETYIGSMVQGRSVKISYKSKKCRKQPPENWIVVEKTHDPIIDRETFRSVGKLLDARRHTRSRTYEYLFKGLVYCRECGNAMGVINRPPVSGEDRLFFVCRTYQRFAGERLCSCHCIKEERVTKAVKKALGQILQAWTDLSHLSQIAAQTLRAADSRESAQQEQQIRDRLRILTEKLDRVYRDRLEGTLDQEDFTRIYGRLCREREALRETDAASGIIHAQEDPEALANWFWNDICGNREFLFRVLERVELTEDKKVLLHFRFRRPEALPLPPSLTIAGEGSIPH